MAQAVEKTKDENNLLKTRNLAASIENLSIEAADDIEYRKPSITDDLVCRRRSEMSDYDYMKEIKKICNPCDPYDLYEKTLRDLGGLLTILAPERLGIGVFYRVRCLRDGVCRHSQRNRSISCHKRY